MIAAIREQCEKALGRQRIVLRWYVWWMRLQTVGSSCRKAKAVHFSFYLSSFVLGYGRLSPYRDLKK
jgi:hypothetical protein